MLKITVEVDGMQCGMCENHVNEAVRGAFPVKKYLPLTVKTDRDHHGAGY